MNPHSLNIRAKHQLVLHALLVVLVQRILVHCSRQLIVAHVSHALVKDHVVQAVRPLVHGNGLQKQKQEEHHPQHCQNTASHGDQDHRLRLGRLGWCQCNL